MYVILTGTAPQHAYVRDAKIALQTTVNRLRQINREVQEMDNPQIQSQYGVPAGSETAFKNQIAGALAAIEGSSEINNILSRMGFST